MGTQKIKREKGIIYLLLILLFFSNRVLNGQENENIEAKKIQLNSKTIVSKQKQVKIIANIAPEERVRMDSIRAVDDSLKAIYESDTSFCDLEKASAISKSSLNLFQATVFIDDSSSVISKALECVNLNPPMRNNGIVDYWTREAYRQKNNKVIVIGFDSLALKDSTRFAKVDDSLRILVLSDPVWGEGKLISLWKDAGMKLELIALGSKVLWLKCTSLSIEKVIKSKDKFTMIAFTHGGDDGGVWYSYMIIDLKRNGHMEIKKEYQDGFFIYDTTFTETRIKDLNNNRILFEKETYTTVPDCKNRFDYKEKTFELCGNKTGRVERFEYKFYEE